jgi:hypothetical protein
VNLYGDLDGPVRGLSHGLLSQYKIESGIAQENINFGAPVMGFVGEEDKVYNLHRDQATLSLSADLSDSNSYSITINGVTIERVYATSHAATMTALINDINTSESLAALGLSIVAEQGSTNRDIVIKAKGGDLVVSGTVTGGVPPTVTVTFATWSKFLGIAMFAQRASKDYAAETACYEKSDMVNVVSEGQVWVPVAAAVADKQSAYAIYEPGETQGQFTNSNSGTLDIGCYFRSNSANSMALLEIRGLK